MRFIFIYLMLTWHDRVIRALVIDNGTHHVINLSTRTLKKRRNKTVAKFYLLTNSFSFALKIDTRTYMYRMNQNPCAKIEAVTKFY